MYALDPHTTPEYSLSVAQRVAGKTAKYERLKELVGEAWLFNVAVVSYSLVAYPFYLYNGFYLRHQRKKLQKSYKFLKSLKIENNETYLLFKKLESKIDGVSPDLIRMTEYTVENAPFLLRFTVSQMQKVSSLVLLISNCIEKKLADLNQPKHNIPSTSSFYFISEKQLWSTRNKVYDYWM